MTTPWQDPPQIRSDPRTYSVPLKPCCGAVLVGEECECAEIFAEMVAAVKSPLRVSWTRDKPADDRVREQLLDELGGGLRPCLWCPGVPVFDNADELLAHIHADHPPNGPSVMFDGKAWEVTR